MNIRMISVLLSVVVLSSSCGTKGRTKKGDKPTDSRSEIPDNKVPETTGRVGDCCDETIGDIVDVHETDLEVKVDAGCASDENCPPDLVCDLESGTCCCVALPVSGFVA